MARLLTLQHSTQLFIGYLPLIVGVLPLLSAIVVGLSRKRPSSHWPATWLLALAMLLGGYLLVLTYHGTTWHGAFTWLYLPDRPFPLKLNFCVDFPAAVMVSLTTTLHLLTHIYALTYLKSEHQRYSVLVGCFVSAMLTFFMANSLIARFMAWELIGLGSYLIIGFEYQQETATKSGFKVWLINQLGSVGLLIGILIIGSELGSFNLTELSALPQEIYRNNSWLVVAKCCLVGGVLTKSAQFPWLGWLPKAMTAPTPASALIHTATMVGAGVYLLVDLAPILGVTTLTYVSYLGGLTAFMGAYAAVAQQHIKQILAYSTVSQLGYAVMAVGVGASGVGLFHFVIHAFGKACLFLCVGAISHFLRQQGRDNAMAMQHMGGLRKPLPGTFWAYLIAAGSLVGIPGSVGSLSKGAVWACTLAWAHQRAQAGSYIGYLVPMLGFVSSFLGMVYMGRTCYLIFMGTPRWSYKLAPNVAYRTPWLMQLSIVILALCSLDWLYSPVLDLHSNWLLQRLAYTPRLASILSMDSKLRHCITLVSIGTMALGILFLVVWRVRSPNTLLLPRHKLALHGWYLDMIFSTVARKVLRLSKLMARLDHQIVNGLVRSISVGYVTLGNIVSWLDQKLAGGMVLLIASVPQRLGKVHRATQQGNLQHSLLWVFISMGLLWVGVYWVTRGVG